MAKVFADDVELDYNGTTQYLQFVNIEVYDSSGNNNGRLDPGETADMTSVLKNIGGSDFTMLNTVLHADDAFVTITDNTGYHGALPVDSIKENTSDPYTVEVSSSAPTGHEVTFTLIAMDGAFSDTFDFMLVVGSYHYLVWNPDNTPSPGENIDSILTSLGYNGSIETMLPTTELASYQAVFVCVGIWPNNYLVSASGPEAAALVGYLENQNGRMYLEGGDVWYYDPAYQGGYDFGPLFGINATADGSGNMGPVVGESGTFTNGMNFTTYEGENGYMDHIDPTGSGYCIFHDGNDAYNCGVANDAGTYKTVGISFELGLLADVSGVSTRAALLDSIMHFFGISLVGTEEIRDDYAPSSRLGISPNPFKGRVSFTWQNSQGGPYSLTIYDATGRVVKSFYGNNDAGSVSQHVWNGHDEHGKKIASGVYFVRFSSECITETRKIVRVE
jgi:hypothetical protein